MHIEWLQRSEKCRKSKKVNYSDSGGNNGAKVGAWCRTAARCWEQTRPSYKGRKEQHSEGR